MDITGATGRRPATSINSYIFGLGLALTGGTQLRTAGIGPGELLLGLALIASFSKLLTRQTVDLRHVPKTYFLILLDVTVLGLLAVLVAESTGTAYADWPKQAMFIIFSISAPLLQYLAFGYYSFVAGLRVFAIATVLFFLVPFMLLQLGITSIGYIEFLYGGSRFLGWSKNPNQAAFLIGLAVPVIYLLASERVLPKLAALPLITVGVFMGISTGSDALLVCWMLLLTMIFFGKKTERKRIGRVNRLLLGFFKTLVLGSIFAVVAVWFFNNSQEIYDGTAQGAGAGQGAIRIVLWLHALEAFLDSPIIGHGHGHFSGFLEPYLGKEAHNFFFDWLSSYGLVGMLLFSLFVFGAISRLLAKKEIQLLAILLMVIGLSMFHFYGRHPAFWTFLLFSGIYANVVRQGSETGVFRQALRK